MRRSGCARARRRDGPVGFVAGRVAERELARRAEAAPPGRGWTAVDNAAKALHA